MPTAIEMGRTMHEAPPVDGESVEVAEHIGADRKQFKVYSYTGNIADYDDDEIFCTLELDKAQELVSWILDHPFLQSRRQKAPKRRRFNAEVRDKAVLAGMDLPTAEALLVYVDKLYAERRKRFSRKKRAIRREGNEQESQRTNSDLSKEDTCDEQADAENVDSGRVYGQDHLTETPLLSATSQPQEGVIDKVRGGSIEYVSARNILPQKEPLVSASGNQNENSLASKVQDQSHENGLSPLSKAKQKSRRKRAARKARRAQRRASERASHATSPRDSPDVAGQNPAPETSEVDHSGLEAPHYLEDAPRCAGEIAVLDEAIAATEEDMVSSLLEFDFFPSDSSLSDIPSDVSSILGDTENRGPSLPAFTEEIQCPTPDSVPVTPVKRPFPRSLSQPDPARRVKAPKISPYFTGQPTQSESCLPFPPISASSFGLVQEQLAHEPFQLLIATIFLNRTRGGVAIPVLFKVFERYPTIESMANAELADLVSMINCLGFQNQRAKKCIALAQTWLASPPTKGKRYRKLHYPKKMDGRDVGTNECIPDDDPRVAWEVSHLPGVGAYAIDSWRIFCRDELRGLSTDWKGSGAEEGFTPEWKSVHPMDKELRAYLTWMWLKEGWVWDRETGQRHLASDKLMRAARRGGVAHEEEGHWILETSPVKAAGFAKRSLEDMNMDIS
ncbi:5-Methylcytosine G/T mismatch-specific DNA glycosylase [Paecilomyces variotii No. 5]|uniref:5-Methylcytosine G/T mismatch-specific DNA glycosylase n=1 Tax=Byssochlamys spectabilis (strain No. 5 / NBRC 109023) TaxID=1356009 RepID=V5I266_BYSSN|nr:5-Methylcytosine G/T mismatch-specific DNA glycosylase [Paecilomyces variotii No. 5]